jgi:hypothetical protein
MKIVDFVMIYNFIVQTFFIWNHLEAHINDILSRYKNFDFKFKHYVNHLRTNNLYYKVVDLVKIYNFSEFIWKCYEFLKICCQEKKIIKFLFEHRHITFISIQVQMNEIWFFKRYATEKEMCRLFEHQIDFKWKGLNYKVEDLDANP